MATDDKNPKFGGGPESQDADRNAEPGAQPDKPRVFVDRDDDQAQRQVDTDYEPGFPGGSDDDADPDPGYAAFASELEDPLSDWPAPEPSDMATAGADDDSGPDTDTQHNDIDRDQLAVFDDDRNAADDAPGPAESADMYFGTGAQRSGFADSDSDASNLSDDESSDPDGPKAHADATGTGTGTGTGTDTVTAAVEALKEQSEPPEVPLVRENTAPPSMAIPDAPDEDFEDEFIDDFLNDLDAPEDPEDEELDPFDDDDAPGRADTRARLSSDAEGGYAAYEIDEADTDEDTVVKQQESNATAAMEETGKNSERSLPVGMFAVVLLALALLAVGGYGVIQQRGELQAEIRDLQSKLATAPSAEDTELEREQQRQMALENESLGAELEALAAENSALATQLSALEEQLAERTAQAEAAQAEAERVAAAAAAAAKKAAAPAARSSAATPAAATQGGPWFVNFGSYAQRDVADRWAGELAVESGKVVVQTATAAGKTLYRVRVVGLATQDSAERVATTLEREYRLPRLWVGKN